MATITNELLYRIQKSLNLSVDTMLKAYELEAFPMSEEHLNALLKPRGKQGFVQCSYEELGLFLDGLIKLKREVNSKSNGSNEEVLLTNNLILKKLRVALELKESEIEIIFALADIILSKQQLKSLFRSEGHKNFKSCSDELLIAFLEGLEEYYYVGINGKVDSKSYMME